MRSQKLSESRCFNFVPLLNWKKIESHFETWSSDAQRINLTFVTYSFVANFVRYISAKYYLNWFSFHTVIMKVLGVNFFWNTVYIEEPKQTCSTQARTSNKGKGKGKCLDTCYSAAYVNQTRDQRRFRISEMAADWHLPQRIMWPSTARANGQ